MTEEIEVNDHGVGAAVTLDRALPLRRSNKWSMALAVAILAAASGVLLTRGLRRSQPERGSIAIKSRHPTFERITVDSRSFDPAVSPDGKFLAYKILANGRESIWVRNIATKSAVQVMPPIVEGYSCLTYSPDGNELFYRTTKAGVTNGLIARVPVFGGTPREVVRNVWSDFTLSPDGKQLVFLRERPLPQPMQALTIVDVESGVERVVARNREYQTWFNLWASGPAWSPDGQRIALTGGVREASGDRYTVVEVSIRDGSLREIPIPAWSETSQVTWLADGTGMFVVARERDAAPTQIWLVPYPKGPVRRITNDLDDYRKVRLSRDARVLVAEQQIVSNHLWFVPDGDASKAVQLTSGQKDSDGFSGLAWTRDGRVLFVSDRTGQQEIWSMKPDGSDVRQVTVNSPSWNRSPRPTADGRFIVFLSNRMGKPHVWRMDADGSRAVRLSSVFSGTPEVSPDGRWVYYMNAERNPVRLEKMSIDGGEPSAVQTEPGASAGSPVLSPDGQMIAYNLYSDSLGWRSALTRLADGKTLRIFDWYADRGQLRWTPDSRAIVYTHHTNSNSNLKVQRIEGGAPRSVTDFRDGRIWNFVSSPDGQDFVVSRGDTLSDIVLIENW